MRRFARMTPVICTLLLLGLGLQMPRLAAAVFDHRLAGEITSMETAGISLTLAQEADFFQTLALFAEANTQIVLSEGYHMTEEAVQAAAVDIMAALALSDTADLSPEVTPVLLSSKSTPGLSSVFWRCVWETKDAYLGTLWLDDQSGELVAAHCRILPPASSSGSSQALSTDGVQAEALQMAAYCRERYPVQQVGLAAVSETPEAWDQADGDGELYLITLVRERDGEAETMSLSLRLRENWLYFNP